jgi:hypothetical protein
MKLNDSVRISFPCGPRRAAHVANTTATTFGDPETVFRTAIDESACRKAGCRRVSRFDAKIMVS